MAHRAAWYVGPAANQTTGSEGSGVDKPPEDTADETGHHKTGTKHGGSATLPMTASQSSMQARGAVQRKFPSDDGSECESSVTSESMGRLDSLMTVQLLLLNMNVDCRYGRTPEAGVQDHLIDLDKKLKYFQEQLNTFREGLDSIKSFQADIHLTNMAIQVRVYLKCGDWCNVTVCRKSGLGLNG